MFWDFVLKLLVAFGTVVVIGVVGGIGIAIIMILKERTDEKYRNH